MEIVTVSITILCGMTTQEVVKKEIGKEEEEEKRERYHIVQTINNTFNWNHMQISQIVMKQTC